MNETNLDAPTDADLVGACLAGDREAYGQIVTRYQRLLCSVAYAALGDFSESEDVAQDAFVEGWQKLPSLREPEKLRGWLCGILRHKLSHRHRRASRRAEYRADPIDAVPAAAELESSDAPVGDQVMRDEEQALLWQALEQVPELYREPLVLFYREHRSIEHVASHLDLTEDTAKQRLSRGRKMLQAQMMAFVEGALSRSTPGGVFTAGVLAALPEFVAPAKAVAGAGVGAAVAHGGAAAKTTMVASVLASVSGLISAVMALRISLDQSRTPAERRLVVKATIACVGGTLAWLGAIYGLRAATFHAWALRLTFAHFAEALSALLMLVWPFAMLKMLRVSRELRAAERRRHPECFRAERDQPGSPAGVYRSRWSPCGVPLVHVRFRTPDPGEPPVVGWIAGGDRAFGLLFAWGLCAVAPVSVGAFSVGLLTVGTVGLGVVALGTFAAGPLAIGCVAFGGRTFAWLLAHGWATAQSGGFALARVAAAGPIAIAPHANDAMARQILADPNAERSQLIFYIVIAVLSLLPAAYYARETRRRLGPKQAERHAAR